MASRLGSSFLKEKVMMPSRLGSSTYVRTYVRTYAHTYVRTYVCTYVRMTSAAQLLSRLQLFNPSTLQPFNSPHSPHDSAAASHLKPVLHSHTEVRSSFASAITPGPSRRTQRCPNLSRHRQWPLRNLRMRMGTQGRGQHRHANGIF